MTVKRLFVFCEGQTEESFCNLVLEPHFRALGVLDLRPLLFPNKRGATSRRLKGGWVNYAAARRFMLHVMHQQHTSETWFTTLADLYAIPHDFPGLSNAPPAPPVMRIQSLEQAFTEDIRSNDFYRFNGHLQLHEYEALLFADCQAIGAAFPNRPDAHTELQADIAGLTPEEVNEGPNTAPSKRIISRIPEYEGLKASAGPIIAAEIGLVVLRQRCPHFDSWMTELETVIRKPD